MKAGVNTKVNLRIAKKATPEVLFQGKKAPYWQSALAMESAVVAKLFFVLF